MHVCVRTLFLIMHSWGLWLSESAWSHTKCQTLILNSWHVHMGTLIFSAHTQGLCFSECTRKDTNWRCERKVTLSISDSFLAHAGNPILSACMRLHWMTVTVILEQAHGDSDSWHAWLLLNHESHTSWCLSSSVTHKLCDIPTIYDYSPWNLVLRLSGDS